MITYTFLQHYWWFVISLLGGILVFLLFVQGGQGMLYRLGRTPFERDIIVTTLGHKWSLTFTTLVTFGGAFFASFPRFYSTSFGGAFYVWMAILFVFVIQAAGYEFRGKAGNILGDGVCNAFLVINGVIGALLLGVAVSTLFTGANFEVNLAAIGNLGGSTAISEWTSPWRGLEAVGDYRNLMLGLAVVFLSRVLASQYVLNRVDNEAITERAKGALALNAVPFLMLFVGFVIVILLSEGYGYDPATGVVVIEDFKFFNNLLAMPVVALAFVVGVVLVLAGIATDLFSKRNKGIWFSGLGTIVTVTALLLVVGWNNTCFYPSLSATQSSLNIANASSGEVTLKVMTCASLLIPIVVSYIAYTWHAMSKTKISEPDYE